MANEAGHVEIQEFSKEVFPQINWMLEDLFCQYGVAMPYFILEYDFPDYSERPDSVSGYNFNLDWGEWGYSLPWFNQLLWLLFDEANLPRWTMPDFSPMSWDMFNSQISQLYENVEQTFGKTATGGTQAETPADWQTGIKYESGRAGTLESISLYVKYKAAAGKVKCAIFDSSLNLLTNGTTEEKNVTSGQDGWITFNFSTAPTVSAATNYYLAYWANVDIYLRTDAEGELVADAKTYNSWNDPLTPSDYVSWSDSIYATYE